METIKVKFNKSQLHVFMLSENIQLKRRTLWQLKYIIQIIKKRTRREFVTSWFQIK